MNHGRVQQYFLCLNRKQDRYYKQIKDMQNKRKKGEMTVDPSQKTCTNKMKKYYLSNILSNQLAIKMYEYTAVSILYCKYCKSK